MNFFTQAGAFIKQGVSNLRNFVFPSPPVPRATQANITEAATNTKFSVQKQQQTRSLFGRISGFFRSAKDKAIQSFDRAKVGFAKILQPKEFKTVKKEAISGASRVAVTGIRTLTDILAKKIGRIGQSGTPVDNRPRVENKAPPTISGSGEENFLGGFEFPFLSSTLGFGNQNAIPTVTDSEGIVVPQGDTVVNNTTSSNILPLLIIGGVAFLLFRK